MPTFHPHPYQEVARKMIFDHAGCALFLEPGLGKAVDDATMVPVPGGAVRADSLSVGDAVIGSDGRPWPIDAVFPQGEKRALEVSLEDGRSYVCCEEHLTPHMESPDGDVLVAPLREVRGKGDVWLPLCSPVDDGSEAPYGAVRDAWDLGRAVLDGAIEDPDSLSWLVGAPLAVRRSFASALLGPLPRPREVAAAQDVALACCRVLWSLGLPCADPSGGAIALRRGPDGSPARSVKVASVRDLGEKRPMRCFTVGSPDHTFLIADHVVTHNTSTVLSVLDDMKRAGTLGPADHALVVAPKAIAKSTWLDEIDKWGFGIEPFSLIQDDRGRDLGRKGRHQRYRDVLSLASPHMCFLNQENVRDMVDFYKAEQRGWPFPILVIDEVQGFKSASSSRFKAIAEARPFVKMFVGLTGTPVPNGVEDIWSQMWLVDGGARLGRTVDDFHNRWFFCSKVPRSNQVKWFPKGAQVEDEVFSRISDVALSVRNDALELPERVDVFDQVHLSEGELATYNEMRETLRAELAEGTVTAKTEQVAVGKLSQMASGTVYLPDQPPREDGTRAYGVVHDRKLEALEQIVRNTEDNVIVAYQFKCDVERIKGRLEASIAKWRRAGEFAPCKGVDVLILDPSDREQQRLWNSGRVRVMLIQPKSAGRGINIQEGGHTLVWYSMPWSLEEYEQTNARIHRQGQKDTVIVHHLMAEGTIDDATYGALQRKARTQDALMEAVRADISVKEGGE